MKKMIFVLMMMAFCVVAWGADLNQEAETLRSKMPEVYEAIRSSAIEEWGQDHAMVVWEINQQSAAMVKIASSMIQDNPEIILLAMAEWTVGGIAAIMEAVDSGNQWDLFILETDWPMVVWEAERQIAAVGEY